MSTSVTTMISCKVTSLGISRLGTVTLHGSLPTQTASTLTALPCTHPHGLSISTSHGQGRARRNFGTNRILAAAAASDASEGAKKTETAVKHENGMPAPAQSESTSMQAARGASSPLMRSLFGDLDEFFPTVRRLRQMLDTMDRMFDDPFLTPVSQARPLMSKQLRDTIRTPWDVKEEEDSYLLRVDIPGFAKDHVKLHVEEGHLVIKADKGSEEKSDKFAFRNYGTFSSRLLLPENADVQKISAALENGVLMVTVPKLEPEKAPKKNVVDVPLN